MNSRMIIVAMVLFGASSPMGYAQRGKAKADAKPTAGPQLKLAPGYHIRPGETFSLTIPGQQLLDPQVSSFPVSVANTQLRGVPGGTEVRWSGHCPADAIPGWYPWRIATARGISGSVPILVSPEANYPVSGPTDKTKPMTVPGPGWIHTTLREGSLWLRWPVPAQKRWSIDVWSQRLGSPLDPMIQIYDDQGRERPLVADDSVACLGDARLSAIPQRDETLLIEIRDSTYRTLDGATVAVRLSEQLLPLGTYPLARSYDPDPSITTPLTPLEPFLPPIPAKILFQPRGDIGWVALPVPGQTPEASVRPGWAVPIRLTESPEILETEPNDALAVAQELPLPGGLSARFATAGDVDWFVLRGTPGDTWTVQAQAFSYDLPTEILMRLKNRSGAIVATSDANTAEPSLDVTIPPEGVLFLQCEPLNLMTGPLEAYRLVTKRKSPALGVNLVQLTGMIPKGGLGLLPLSDLTEGSPGFSLGWQLADEPRMDYQVPAQAQGRWGLPIRLPQSAATTRIYEGAIRAGLNDPLATRVWLTFPEGARGEGPLAGSASRFQRMTVALRPQSAQSRQPRLETLSGSARPGDTIQGQLRFRASQNGEGPVQLVTTGGVGLPLVAQSQPAEADRLAWSVKIPADAKPGWYQIAPEIRWSQGPETIREAAWPQWLEVLAPVKK